MKAGRLRYRVTIQMPVFTRDEYGQPVQSYSDFCSIWADIDSISGREYISANAEQSEITTKIWVRYRDGITSDMRVVHKETVYEIKVVLPNSKRSHICLMCLVANNA